MAKTQKITPKVTAEQVKGPYVLPEEVEEEAKIASIEFYQDTIPMLALFISLFLATGGTIVILCKWKNTLFTRLISRKSNHHHATRMLVNGADGTVEPVKIIKKDLCLDGQIKNYRCFVYRLYTYYYDVNDSLFKPVQFEIKDKTYEEVLKEFGNGITSMKTYNERLITYGKNSTDIEKKSNLEILIDEVSSPFYVFQLLSIIFWAVWNDYFMYAMIILGISLLTIVINLVKTKISLKKLYARAHYEIDVSVFRSNEGDTKPVARLVSSSTLVPGDLIEIPCDKKMPCDVILVTGTCVMNESMLTGESIPLIKQHITATDKVFDARNADQYLLYSGTECLETRRAHLDVPVMGFVLRTGFDTMKGRLVRSFLYSKPENFKFYRDSVKYIGAMGVVALICFCVGIKAYIRDEADVGEYFIHIFEIITCAVPPALPTCLAVGTAMSAWRLEKKKILTKTELKINVAGRVKVMCFDKTGTLTRDSLDLFGVRTIQQNGGAKFEHLVSENIHSAFNSSSEKSINQQMLELMATCHTLTYVKVRNGVSGDPLDLKMFEATKWNLRENDGTSGSETNLCTLTPPLGGFESGYYKSTTTVEVIKRFEFVAKLQRMSCIVKDPQESKQRLYVKGSPEVLSTLCKPETIPEDFNKALLVYTQSGLRVIACATKVLSENVSVHSQVERDSFENNLEFLGFLVFENKLKEVTPSIIAKLKDADIDTMMLTGDNPLTAIFVARDCGIVEKHNRVILGSMVSTGGDSQTKKLEWKYIEETLVHDGKDAPKALPGKEVQIEMVPADAERKPIAAPQEQMSGEVAQNQLMDILKRNKHVAVALTGDATNYIANSTEVDEALRKKVFKRSKVFARMKPDDKAFIIDKLQNQGEIVGMCGDGANDCPALKVANVGIALSETEASLAAPFMSRIIDISSVDIVLREGRTALVTSFQCFKFMSIYALIQTFNIAILNTRSSGMSNGTFLYEDLYVVLPICLTMGMTRPTDKLSKKRPTENLLSAGILIGMFGQCIIQVVGQVIATVILNHESWYMTNEDINLSENPGYDADMLEEEEITTTDWDLTVVFLVAAFQFFATVMTFSIGKPFRKPFYTNIVFTICLLYSTITTLVLILIPVPDLITLLELRDFEFPHTYVDGVPVDVNGQGLYDSDGNILNDPTQLDELSPGSSFQWFRWILLAIVLVNGLITYLYEKYGVSLIISGYRKLVKTDKKNKKNKKQKKIEN